MFLAWTTTATKADAERLASGAVAANLAACVQIDGPIRSFYRWEGRLAQDEEYRLTFKCLSTQLSALAAFVHDHHPYTTPEWIALPATHVSEKYLSWAQANATSPPL